MKGEVVWNEDKDVAVRQTGPFADVASCDWDNADMAWKHDENRQERLLMDGRTDALNCKGSMS